MESKNETWMMEEFSIYMDETINGYARCEFPDEKMRDVPFSTFPFEPKERERYLMRYAEEGNLIFISKIIRNTNYKNRRIRPKWMRFSKRR